MVNTLVNQAGLSRAEANTRVDNWISSYEQLKAEAMVRADEIAKAASTASIISFFALIHKT